MKKFRIATKEDFKVGTVLFDKDGNSFGLRRKYSDGIWECNNRVHFEGEAKFYRVELKEMKATIYLTEDLLGSVVKIEGTILNYGTRKYAQYNNAPYIDYIPQGKRKARRIMKSYNPYIVILPGINHPDPMDAFIKVDEKCSKSRYLSFDERYKTDFDFALDKYINENNINVIVDYRHTKGFSSY